MALTDKLTAIGSAVRVKNGSSSALTLPQIADGVLHLPSPAPVYHYTHAYDVVSTIRALQNSNTVTFGVITDTHVSDPNSGGSGATYTAQTRTSIRRAAFALETVGKMVGADFVANLGDNVWENNIDTDAALASMQYFNDVIFGVFDNFTSFRLPGNHDQSSTFGKMYSYVGAYNNSFDVSAATPQRGYGYKDFADKKLRVICLNTSDYYNATGGYGMSYEQKTFLMNALDLSGKTTPSAWKILLLSHFPLDFPSGDYNTVNDVQAILNAYVVGSTVSITVNGTYAAAENESVSGTISYNYSGKNAAQIVANIHGHIHNHCYGWMATNNIVRISAPNTCFKLEASACDVGDGMYDYATAYPKTIGTYAETAVTFFVIDTDAETISAIVYGAGVDRTGITVDPPAPYSYVVADLAAGSRSTWNIDSSGSGTQGIVLSSANGYLALGVSTANDYAFTDRDNNPLYLMPVPAQATKFTVSTIDQTLDRLSYKGIKLNGSNYTKVLEVNNSTTFNCSFARESIDYLAISLVRSDEGNVAWNYPDSNVTVTFTND